MHLTNSSLVWTISQVIKFLSNIVWQAYVLSAGKPVESKRQIPQESQTVKQMSGYPVQISKIYFIISFSMPSLSGTSESEFLS